jgi:hypothetical protein
VRLLWLQNFVQGDLLSRMSNNRARHSASVMVWYCRSLLQRSTTLDMMVCTYFRFGMWQTSKRRCLFFCVFVLRFIIR